MSNVPTRSDRITPFQYVPRTHRMPLTRASGILDAEEARGSHPLAPTRRPRSEVVVAARESSLGESHQAPRASTTAGSTFIARALSQ